VRVCYKLLLDFDGLILSIFLRVGTQLGCKIWSGTVVPDVWDALRPRTSRCHPQPSDSAGMCLQRVEGSSVAASTKNESSSQRDLAQSFLLFLRSTFTNKDPPAPRFRLIRVALGF
jgi:hypothetical protein